MNTYCIRCDYFPIMLPFAGCSNSEQGNIRLVNGTSPLEGRLEICNSGRWGTVCDDMWGTADANVACRQLGFSGTGIVVYSHYPRLRSILPATMIPTKQSVFSLSNVLEKWSGSQYLAQYYHNHHQCRLLKCKAVVMTINLYSLSPYKTGYSIVQLVHLTILSYIFRQPDT